MKKKYRTKLEVIILVIKVLIAAVLAGVVLWAGYYLGLTNIVGNYKQAAILAEVEESFETPAPAEVAAESPAVEVEPAEGEALGVVLRIPRFGDGYAEPVLEGTTDSTMNLGVSHYTGNAMPCEVGNFAITAHRITHGANFRNIHLLVVGDEIVAETSDAICTYVVDGHVIVDEGPSTSVILNPVPEVAGLVYAEDDKYITLISCHPLWSTDQRYVVFGHLASVTYK